MEDLQPGVWHQGDRRLPATGTLCALDLGSDEYRVAKLVENESYDGDGDDEDEEGNLPWIWCDENTGEEWSTTDVYWFCILPPPR